MKDVTSNYSNIITEKGILEVNKRDVTLTSATLSKKYDGTELTNENGTVRSSRAVGVVVNENGLLVEEGWADGEGAAYEFTGSQTLVGTSKNAFEITYDEGTNSGNYNIIKTEGDLTITDGDKDDPVDPGKVVTKEHNGREYELGETVNFVINVTNIYDDTKMVTVTEKEGVIIEGASSETPNVITLEMSAGEKKSLNATYTIQESDIAAGTFINEVTVEFDEKPYTNTDEVDVEPEKKSYIVNKKASVSEHESGMFKVGETIHYTIYGREYRKPDSDGCGT